MLGRDWDNLGLLNPDPGTAAPEGGTKLKKRSIQSRNEKSSTGGNQEQPDPRPEVVSKSNNRPVTSMIQLETRLQAPIPNPISVPMAPKKIRRRPWSTAEKEAVWRQLGVHVLLQSVPGKEVCQRCLDLEPVLRGRHWKDIKNQIHNQIQSQKKQQFHAQADLQGNLEQQDQIQNQKQQQQHLQPQLQRYQSPIDQQTKDHIQNQNKKHCQPQMDQHDPESLQVQRKQQYHIQMDHEEQDSIHNQKKHQYHTQLDHHDHLQIHKKQLCHARLDHQDHVQVQKKQLYQMDQPPQGMHTTINRDTSILTASPYGPDGPHQAQAHSIGERDPIISPYPLPHRTPGPQMDQLVSRTEWTDESLNQNYPISRHLARNLLQEVQPGGPLPNPHSGHVHF
ncbi:hypothetical protein Q5P01_003164 [Channa striata]|uniref:Uncharacterized protein n=1 Tax=Channa striata TaxID=64152 RepID=A0AA88NNX4_CHASR|nr:hypothetical protein Q5P01_003164 [Channa striata]